MVEHGADGGVVVGAVGDGNAAAIYVGDFVGGDDMIPGVVRWEVY